MANDGAYITNADVQLELNAAKDRIKVGDSQTDNITAAQIQTYILKVEGRFLEEVGQILSLPLSIPVEYSIDEALIARTCFRIYKRIYRPKKSDGKEFVNLLDDWKTTYKDLIQKINGKKLKLTNNSYRSSGAGAKSGNAYGVDSSGDIYSTNKRSEFYEENPT